MAGNIDPIYARKGSIGLSAPILAANTAMDGTGTVTTAFTADAINGSYIQKLRFKAVGTNVQSVARIFINNGATNAVATNNVLFDEITLSPVTASSNSAVVAIDIPLGFALPAGYKINITLGTAVAAGWQASAICGDY